MRKLTNVAIKNSPDGTLQDGGGLMLQKKGTGGKWIWRYSHLGKRRDMELGSYPLVSLADARRLRDTWAAALAQGRDPISERRDEQEAAKRERDRADPTFAELVDLVFEAKKASLCGDGTRGMWLSPLRNHMVPVMGGKRGSALTQHDVYDALKPIWRKKHPTPEKAVQRTRIVLRSAKRMGFSTDPNIVDAAQEMLGVVDHQVIHTPSVPWQDIPELYPQLGGTTSERCNQWAILTLVRLDGCLGARVSEIDLDARIWTVPKERIKGRKGKVQDFRVPLSEPALEIVREAKEVGLDLLFPGQRNPYKPISNAAAEKCLRTLEAGGTPHGFRTSLRT